MKRFQIIVEGDADKKFFRDYYHHLFQEKAPENSIIFPKDNSDTGGKDKLKSEVSGAAEGVFGEEFNRKRIIMVFSAVK